LSDALGRQGVLRSDDLVERAGTGHLEQELADRPCRGQRLRSRRTHRRPSPLRMNSVQDVLEEPFEPRTVRARGQRCLAASVAEAELAAERALLFDDLDACELELGEARIERDTGSHGVPEAVSARDDVIPNM